MTGFGRAGFGSDQALASRYGTLAAPIWIAVLFLGLSFAAGTATGWNRRRAAAVVAVGLVLALGSIASGQQALVHAKARAAHLRMMRLVLRGASDWPTIATLYGGNVPVTQERGEQLKAMGFSVFREQ